MLLVGTVIWSVYHYASHSELCMYFAPGSLYALVMITLTGISIYNKAGQPEDIVIHVEIESQPS